MTVRRFNIRLYGDSKSKARNGCKFFNDAVLQIVEKLWNLESRFVKKTVIELRRHSGTVDKK